MIDEAASNYIRVDPKCNRRLTWKQRASIVYLYLHKQICNRNLANTASLTGVSLPTLRGWVTNPELMAKWLCFLKKMTAELAFSHLNLNIKDYPLVEPDDLVDISEFRNVVSQKYIPDDFLPDNQTAYTVSISSHQKSYLQHISLILLNLHHFLTSILKH